MTATTGFCLACYVRTNLAIFHFGLLMIMFGIVLSGGLALLFKEHYLVAALENGLFSAIQLRQAIVEGGNSSLIDQAQMEFKVKISINSVTKTLQKWDLLNNHLSVVECIHQMIGTLTCQKAKANKNSLFHAVPDCLAARKVSFTWKFLSFLHEDDLLHRSNRISTKPAV